MKENMRFRELISRNFCPTSGLAVLLSKLVDGRCQIQSSVEIVNLVVRSFPKFLPKYGLGPPPVDTGTLCGQLELTL